MSKQELELRMRDLEGVKKVLNDSLNNLLLDNDVSKKGLVRIVKVMGSFPDVPKVKLQSETEVAVIETLMSLKEVQLSMLTIASQLSTK